MVVLSSIVPERAVQCRCRYHQREHQPSCRWLCWVHGAQHAEGLNQWWWPCNVCLCMTNGWIRHCIFAHQRADGDAVCASGTGGLRRCRLRLRVLSVIVSPRCDDAVAEHIPHPRIEPRPAVLPHYRRTAGTRSSSRRSKRRERCWPSAVASTVSPAESSRRAGTCPERGYRRGGFRRHSIRRVRDRGRRNPTFDQVKYLRRARSGEIYVAQGVSLGDEKRNSSLVAERRH